MHTAIQLVPTGAHTPSAGRAGQAVPVHQRPQVRELPLRLEPVDSDTFGGLVNGRGTPPLRAVLTS